jgi:hypothetical protein
LILWVRVFCDYLAIHKIGGHTCNLGERPAVLSEEGYEQARAFYEGKLGFQFVSLDQYALVLSVGGHKIRIAKVPNFTPLQGTILGWEVKEIETVVTWLRDRGVTLEKYPFVQDRVIPCHHFGLILQA